jgi:hypothetical protein
VIRRTRSGQRDDAELDALLSAAWEDRAAVVARTLDLQAGREALLATARPEKAGDTAGQAGGALGAALAQADAMLAVITAHLEPDQGPAHSHVMIFLYASRQYLLQVRAGLAGRSLSRGSARQQLRGLDHALTEAGRTLMALPAGPVTDDERYELGALVAGLRAQIPELTSMVERLFDDAGHAAVPVPAR